MSQKLYRVEITFETFVLADDESDAVEVAEMHYPTIAAEVQFEVQMYPTRVVNLKDVPTTKHSSVPFQRDVNPEDMDPDVDELTIADVLR